MAKQQEEKSKVFRRSIYAVKNIKKGEAFTTENIRVILPGKCYRYEQITLRSEHQFFQVEGLAVGQNIRLTDLIGVMTEFARKMYGQEREVRIR